MITRGATMIRVFSLRLKWDSPVNPLAALLAEKRRPGANVLDLTESNPTHAGFEYSGDAILAALADGRSLRYDPAPRGLQSARDCTIATTRSPQRSSGTPTTTASKTSGWAFNTDSTSSG